MWRDKNNAPQKDFYMAQYDYCATLNGAQGALYFQAEAFGADGFNEVREAVVDVVPAVGGGVEIDTSDVANKRRRWCGRGGETFADLVRSVRMTDQTAFVLSSCRRRADG